MSRLAFFLRLDRWPKDELQAYLQARLAEVGIHASPLERAAEELLLQSAQGSPRALNSLLQRTLEIAATAGRRFGFGSAHPPAPTRRKRRLANRSLARLPAPTSASVSRGRP